MGAVAFAYEVAGAWTVRAQGPHDHRGDDLGAAAVTDRRSSRHQQNQGAEWPKVVAVAEVIANHHAQ